MPINRYKLSILHYDCEYVIEYKNNKFSSLTRSRGELPLLKFANLMKLVPVNENELQGLNELVTEHASYQLIIKRSQRIFTRCMIEYQLWYEEKTSMPPKIDGISGNALKAIIAHLTKQSTNEEEAYQLWLHILNSWHLVAEFYRQQKELRQINSNINTILNHIKNGKEESTSNIKDLQDTFRSKDGAG